MCLKLLFSHSKWVLQVFLSLTVLLNCVSVSSNFDSAFLPDCTTFCSVFSCYWIGNLMRIPKMCLKLSFSHSQWALQVILSLTVFSLFLTLTPLFSRTVPNIVVFFYVIE